MVAHLSVFCQILPWLYDFVLQVCKLFVETCFSRCSVFQVVFDRAELMIYGLDDAGVGVGDGGVIWPVAVFSVQLDIYVAFKK